MSEFVKYNYTDILPTSQRMLKYGEKQSQTLIPCARIEDPNLYVGVLGLKTLKPERFRIRGARDRQPIILFDMHSKQTLTVHHPGKSAFLHLDEGTTNIDIQEVVHKCLNRPATRQDHLHLATIEDLNKVGWQTWWTPLPSRGNPLHVRLISDRTIDDGNDPTENDRNELATVFVRVL